MVIVFSFLIVCTAIFLIAMGIAFRNAPTDPYEKIEEEEFLEKSKPENSIQVVTDDGEEDEELDEEQDNENEEDQD